MEKTSSNADSWGSGLPCDLARCIGDRLDVLARICFRAVCRSWRAALPAGRVTSIPSPLVLLPTALPGFAFPLRSLVDSCGGTSYNPLALQLHLVDAHSELRCVGSTGGWLAVTDSIYAIWLVNALTFQVAARLPPLPRNTEARSLQARGPFSVSLTPDDSDDGLRRRQHIIHKVAFTVKPSGARGSSYAHSAVALHRSAKLRKGLALSFIRDGWDRWEWRMPAFFRHGEDEHFDVAYCQRSGVYYVVTPLGWVWVLDLSALVPTLVPLVRCHSFRELTVAHRRHAVVLSDDNGDSQMYMVILTEREEQRVIVQRYTAGEPWSVVSNLSGRALLIAKGAQSVSVMPTAASPPWLKPDCVYWMTPDGFEQGMAPAWRFHVPTCTTDMFVVGVQHEQTAVWMLDWQNSIWITPSLT